MMDLELRISQYIDGELSGEEEAELHHMLAVSPEARVLFREHLTLRTIAHDERILHRPAQEMRESLFARLQAEEGMKSSAVVVASVGVAGGIVASDIPGVAGRVAPDRTPIASQDDPRSEERRRRRRLIPILIPLMLCVIVGGIWYGGGFGGSGEGSYADAGIGAAKETVAGKSGGNSLGYNAATSTQAPQPNRPNEAPAVETPTSSAPEHYAALSSSESHASARRRSFSEEGREVALQASPEELAYYDASEMPAGAQHDVLGNADSAPMNISGSVAEDDGGNYQSLSISPKSTTSLTADREKSSYRAMIAADTASGFDFRPTADQDIGGYMSMNVDGELSLGTVADQDEFVPEESSLLSSQDDFALGSSPASAPPSSFGEEYKVRAEGNEAVRIDGGELAADDNSVMRSDNVLDPVENQPPPVYSGKWVDSATGRSLIPTMANKEEIQHILQQRGFSFDNDSAVALGEGAGSLGSYAVRETGNRFAEQSVVLGGGGNMFDNTGTLYSVSVDSARDAEKPKTPILALIERKGEGQSPYVLDSVSRPNAIVNRDIAEASAAHSASSVDAPLSPVSPRRIDFFVGLDQAIGATVSSVPTSLSFAPSSIPAFADNGGMASETRLMLGAEFDGGRQRVFATVGVWSYDEQESFRTRTTTQQVQRTVDLVPVVDASGTTSMVAVARDQVINTTATTTREEERGTREIWGGAGYRYSLNISQKVDAGAEVWGGIGSNYLHAGLTIPVSYKLNGSLRIELTPGLRYHGLHSSAETVVTGTLDPAASSSSGEEHLITPRDDHRLEGVAGIGLILLLH